MEELVEKKLLSRRRSTIVQQPLKVKDERSATVKKVAAILHKTEDNRTSEECEILSSCSDIVKEINLRQEKRDKVKARLEEFEDPPEILEEKCVRLAAAISRAKSLTVYTGAGISTAASIPDYRGTNGVWTRMQQGKDIGNHDLSQAEPTLTHMALYALYKAGILKFVVSQNCDGLHLRSGIPRALLSEVHGNMYVEVCRNCKPSREYWRLFDVTEKTARYAHATGRACHKCNSSLQDSIVHFGERGNLLWPINWSGASRAAKQADVILCLGSSLKVLKKYPWLWQMDKPVVKRAQLYIVNLQWTPKDETATLKINGKCDKVMKIVMSHLGIDFPEYNRGKDPIFYHAIKLQNSEVSTTSQPCLEEPVKEFNEIKNEEDIVKVDEMMEEERNGRNYDDHNDDVQTIEDIPKLDRDDQSFENSSENHVVLSEEPIEKNQVIEKKAEEKVYDTQITLQEPIIGYPAPFFAALPFLSMGLPFPPMYMYPQLTPIFYYPYLQFSPTDAMTQTDQEVEYKKGEHCLSKPKPTCNFCMENEGSLTCLYYQRNIDDDLTVDDLVAAESPNSTENVENKVTDENVPATVVAAKNPGWFGKGYRKGMKRKR